MIVTGSRYCTFLHKDSIGINWDENISWMETTHWLLYKVTHPRMSRLDFPAVCLFQLTQTENTMWNTLILCNHARYREILRYFPDAMFFHKLFAINTNKVGHKTTPTSQRWNKKSKHQSYHDKNWANCSSRLICFLSSISIFCSKREHAQS